MNALTVSLRSFAALFIFVLVFGHTPAYSKDKKEQKPFLDKPVSPKQSIRFYKANRALQVDRIAFTGGETKAPGCHNFLKKNRVYKVLQIGFAVCHLYAKKGCDVSSLVPVANEEQEFGSFMLKEGAAWFPQSEHEQGAKVGSWSCNMELAEGEMRQEFDLIRVERNRMKGEERKAKERLEKAQKRFAQAKKTAKDANEYTNRVKSEAIKMGVIEPDPEPEEEDEDKDKEKGNSKAKEKETE